MSSKASNLAVLASPKPRSKPSFGDHATVDLMLALQSTLDLEQLLSIFSTRVSELVAHDGYVFSDSSSGSDISGGRWGRHVASYALKLEDHHLGELAFSRDRRFRSLDLQNLENMLCHLLYPLRNALRYQEVLRFARTDSLTQVGNRGCLFDCLQREFELARRYDSVFSVIFLDIDHFKRLNDSLGHAAGDTVLRGVARALRDSIRASDALFRYGGEEFVVVLSNTALVGARQLAERLRAAVENASFAGLPADFQVTASFGVAALDAQDQALDLLQRADSAMYQAKARGRNRVEVIDQGFSPTAVSAA